MTFAKLPVKEPCFFHHLKTGQKTTVVKVADRSARIIAGLPNSIGNIISPPENLEVTPLFGEEKLVAPAGSTMKKAKKKL